MKQQIRAEYLGGDLKGDDKIVLTGTSFEGPVGCHNRDVVLMLNFEQVEKLHALVQTAKEQIKAKS